MFKLCAIKIFETEKHLFTFFGKVSVAKFNRSPAIFVSESEWPLSSSKKFKGKNKTSKSDKPTNDVLLTQAEQNLVKSENAV